MSAAASGGAGIRIGHPDSGYTFHPKLGAAGLDLTTDRDVIDGDDDALDDLIPNPNWPLPNPGHGTSTASVIVGQGSGSDPVLGLAPMARLVPIRATEVLSSSSTPMWPRRWDMPGASAVTSCR